MNSLAPPLPANLLGDPPLGPLPDPSTLSEDADKAVQAFFHEGQSRNTARTYKTALQYWGAWHSLRYGAPIEGPVAPAVVIQFIVDHLEHRRRSIACSLIANTRRDWVLGPSRPYKHAWRRSPRRTSNTSPITRI